MGQKVQPLGFRRGIPAKRRQSYILGKKKVDIFHRQSLYDGFPGKENYSKILRQRAFLDYYRREIIKKCGFLVNRCWVNYGNLEVKVNLEIYQPQKITQFSLSQLEFTLHQWFSLTLKNHFLQGIPVKWELHLLNKEISRYKGKLPVLTRRRNLKFQTDLSNLLCLTMVLPCAPLIADFISQELSRFPRHQFFFDIVSQGFRSLLGERPAIGEESPGLSAGVLQIKGRIDGAERSLRSRVRLGSIPLHTLDCPLDYGYSERITPYGVLGVKVWFRYV